MDIDGMRMLLQGLDTVTVEEVVHTAQEAGSDPTSARKLWGVLLSASAKDERLRLVLQLLLESVLVDQVNHHVTRDDEYALVIGRRVVAIMEKVSPLMSSQQVQAA